MQFLNFIIFLILVANFANGDVCQVESIQTYVNDTDEVNITVSDDSSSPRKELITCPQPSDPPEYTFCCYDRPEDDSGTFEADDVTVATCCPLQLQPQQPRLFYFISDQLALIIAISLTALLLIITIVIVVCCFWSRCPLYMTCRVRYRKDDIIASAKDDETANLNDMPPEEQKGVTVYSPNAVKVTPKDDV